MQSPKTKQKAAAKKITPDKDDKPKIKGGVQPKTQPSKCRIATAQRRKKIVKAILEGKTQEQAAISAGYSPKSAATQASQVLRHPSTQKTLAAALEKIGITDEYLSQKLQALIDGKRHLPARGDMIDSPGSPGYVEVIDNVARAKGIELAVKIKGQISDKVEGEIKQPVNIIIRKFCSRGEQDKEGATTQQDKQQA